VQGSPIDESCDELYESEETPMLTFETEQTPLLPPKKKKKKKFASKASEWNFMQLIVGELNCKRKNQIIILVHPIFRRVRSK
jgi:hypothetical protein